MVLAALGVSFKFRTPRSPGPPGFDSDNLAIVVLVSQIPMGLFVCMCILFPERIALYEFLVLPSGRGFPVIPVWLLLLWRLLSLCIMDEHGVGIFFVVTPGVIAEAKRSLGFTYN